MTIDQNKAFDFLCSLAREVVYLGDLCMMHVNDEDYELIHKMYTMSVARSKTFYSICDLQPDEDEIFCKILKGRE
jgi:hypothetical protein